MSEKNKIEIKGVEFTVEKIPVEDTDGLHSPTENLGEPDGQFAVDYPPAPCACGVAPKNLWLSKIQKQEGDQSETEWFIAVCGCCRAWGVIFPSTSQDVGREFELFWRVAPRPTPAQSNHE